MSPVETIYLNEIIPESYIYGPGKRFVIWVQGCSLHCKGCWNKDLWDFNTGDLYHVDQIMTQINSISDLEGITLLGGEPLDQALDVLSLIKKVKQHSLSVLLYTGYEFEEIDSDPVKKQIFNLSDIVISGRYIQELRDLSLKWRGSSNQVITLNNNDIDFIDERLNQVEIHYSNDGGIKIIGYPDNKFINEMVKNEFKIRETV